MHGPRLFAPARLRPPAVGLMLLAVAVAGCAQSPELPPAQTTPTANRPAGAALAVLVLDAEHRPVGDALVELVGAAKSAQTGSDGVAFFPGLEVGIYTVMPAKAGMKPVQGRGWLVEVHEDEPKRVTVVLEGLSFAAPGTGYSRVFPMKGFIACALYVMTPVDQCGSGISYGGQHYLRDPQQNTTHPWVVENRRVQAYMVEAQWGQTSPAPPPQLNLSVSRRYTCNLTCGASEYPDGREGASPIRWTTTEGTDELITKRTGSLDRDYPSNLVLQVHQRRGWTSHPVSVAFQQRYDAYVSVFYLEGPPTEYTALPR